MNLRSEPADHAVGRSCGGLSTKIHPLSWMAMVALLVAPRAVGCADVPLPDEPSEDQPVRAGRVPALTVCARDDPNTSVRTQVRRGHP
jgi:hypothetical protein